MRFPRLRLTFALPAVVVVLIAAGFLAAAFSVVADVGVPEYGLRLHRSLLFWGALTVGAGWLVAWLLAGVLTEPLERLRRRALHPDAALPGSDESPFAEVRGALWALDQFQKDYAERLTNAALERQELEALVDAVSEGILHVAPDGRLAKANPAAVDMLGLPHQATGQPLGTVIRNAGLREALTQALRDHQLEPRELALDERRLLVTADPLPPGGIVITLTDLTDLRRLEEVRRDFVANASHELKTPLTSIRGYAETLLSADLPTTDARGFLEIVARNAERLQHIVDDLLDLSRLESGRWQPQIEVSDIAEIARHVWEGAYAEAAAERSIGFTADEEGLLANADPSALEQIFGNLFSNALRHTPDGGRVGVHVSRCEELPGPAQGGRHRPTGNGTPAGPWALVQVQDDGTGVPHDALSRIFERFYRVDPARSRAEGGTGLGLSIVKHLVESMGGSVWAESELGRGTTIAFALPVGPGGAESGRRKAGNVEWEREAGGGKRGA